MALNSPKKTYLDCVTGPNYHDPVNKVASFLAHMAMRQ